VFRSLTPQQANELISSGAVEVVDVREPKEWSGGHVAGARLVPLERLRAAPQAELPRDGVLFVCAAGVRSETAARVASGLGLAKVYSLSGGLRNWTKAGLPLVKELLSA
jgi:adenylyltransferase/sulfurtransferase